ncbi:hypothetical protein AB9E85_05900 [Escherichia coli]|uniref:hypothetical protein n=1 Tax=Escherichia coli TaxID=562 RepID=UPI000BB9445D|nr:hypothetical protein [Escherichia coli]EFN9101055.1 hypothetical protein [Escherichia coli]EIY1065579.1 hypothetical protein [Escherichia coli]ELD1760755.1 hypothetical protein [Escherichia coli]ELD1782943.1 hypothetical protein [Escherichia coli]ELJ4030597.1 hypothetical protein [Escherichia coli]
MKIILTCLILTCLNINAGISATGKINFTGSIVEPACTTNFSKKILMMSCTLSGNKKVKTYPANGFSRISVQSIDIKYSVKHKNEITITYR